MTEVMERNINMNKTKYGRASMADSGKVNIHGKEYLTVAYRIREFRAEYTEYGIETDVIGAAELVTVKATIKDPEGRIISTGYAEEKRDSTNINKTSALENAETSAVGRALAFFGLAGTEIASADEVQNAITQQGEKDAQEKAAKCSEAVRNNWASVGALQELLAAGNYSAAKEVWNEIPDNDKASLWLATTKGGIFTTNERNQMKSEEWNNA